MPGATRRTLLGSATSLAAAGVFAGSLQNTSSVAQSVAGSSQYGVKALFFDVFGTLVDWRTGIAREAESHLKSRGYALDWLAFADAWRAQYQPGMEEVRSGRIPFSKLDVLHRRMLDRLVGAGKRRRRHVDAEDTSMPKTLAICKSISGQLPSLSARSRRLWATTSTDSFGTD